MKGRCVRVRVRGHLPSCDLSNFMVSMSYSDAMKVTDQHLVLDCYTYSIAATLVGRGVARKRVLVDCDATCWHTA